MVIKIILILSALIMVGCSVFPSTTSISATTKATADAVPTIKAQQNFKWSKD
jgi:FlaG/FlaF family flagellin (archaellin)